MQSNIVQSLYDDIEYFQHKVWTSCAIPDSYFLNSKNPELTTTQIAEIDFDRAMKVVR